MSDGRDTSWNDGRGRQRRHHPAVDHGHDVLRDQQGGRPDVATDGPGGYPQQRPGPPGHQPYDERAGYRDNGYPPPAYDANGYPVQAYDANGYPVQTYDANGYPVQAYDANGYPIRVYDGNGYDANGYDQYGYDVNGRDANGYPANYGGPGRPFDPELDQTQAGPAVNPGYDPRGPGQPPAGYGEPGYGEPGYGDPRYAAGGYADQHASGTRLSTAGLSRARLPGPGSGLRSPLRRPELSGRKPATGLSGAGSAGRRATPTRAMVGRATTAKGMAAIRATARPAASPASSRCSILTADPAGTRPADSSSGASVPTTTPGAIPRRRPVGVACVPSAVPRASPTPATRGRPAEIGAWPVAPAMTTSRRSRSVRRRSGAGAGVRSCSPSSSCCSRSSAAAATGAREGAVLLRRAGLLRHRHE